MPDRPLSRRAFLRAAGTIGIVGGAMAALPRTLSGGSEATLPETITAHAVAARMARWSDPKTWGGRVPGPRDVAVVSAPVLLDVDARVAGVNIKTKGRLVFQPGRSRILESSGNVVVDGGLSMHPSNASIVHTLRFVHVDESKFKGGGMNVLASDVGLWIRDNGMLDVAGTPKLEWTRVAGSVAPHDAVIHLVDEPRGWYVGDEVAITPTLPPTSGGFASAYDVVTITQISGKSIRVAPQGGTTALHAHPAVPVVPGMAYGAEVLNLTRNVRIEGTPGGRTHVHIMSMMPQMISYSAHRYVGPQNPVNHPVLGRYGLHFHEVGNGSRGSMIRGVVVRDDGNRAFVPHNSHGITFVNCIAHNVADRAFGWDIAERNNQGDPTFITNDLMLAGCVASLVTGVPSQSQAPNWRLHGFGFGMGKGNVARGCVATGVQTGAENSGFNWPDGNEGSWTVEDCVGHNNNQNGLLLYQSDNYTRPPVTRFVGYHNGASGIFHGGYHNHQLYRDCVLYGNMWTQLYNVATPTSDPAIHFDRLLCDGAGFSDYAVVFTQDEPIYKTIPVQINDGTFKGYNRAACWLQAHPGSEKAPNWLIDLVDCTYSGNEFWLDPNITPGARVRMQDARHGALAVYRRDHPQGKLMPRWNAKFENIRRFYPPPRGTTP